MAETVLVTGGTGFVGGWCIVQLLDRGYRVRTTVRSLAKEAAVRAAVAREVGADDRLDVVVADLTKDDGWDAAADGCAFVLHVASPLGGTADKDPDSLIVPAREGTLRVLRAATKAGARRVVVTSSGAASARPPSAPDGDDDETLWTDPTAKGLTAYRRSKYVAERAAWDFMAERGATTTLSTVLPGGIFGPVLSADGLGSVQIIQRLLKGALPGTPGFGFNVVDVRDVADLHLRSMTSDAAAGERFLAAGEYLWVAEVAKLLKAELGDRAAKVPTRALPNLVLRAVALFDPALRSITPMLGRRHGYSSAKAERVLGWTPRPARETLVACAESLIALGAV